MNAIVLAPVYRINGEEYQPGFRGEGVFADERFRVCQTMQEERPELTRVNRKWTNISESRIEFQCALYVRTDFCAKHYVIPCVMYNGNEWGAGLEPKGLERNGEPWVFSSLRTGIPGLTVSENAEEAMGLFAAGDATASLRCSCSLARAENGAMIHALWYPDIEKPLTYVGRDLYGEASEPVLCLEPGESIAFGAYIWHGKPWRENYAIANVQDLALELFHPAIPEPPDAQTLRAAGYSYAYKLLTEFDGGSLFAIGLHPENGGFKKIEHFEIGWCGQNALFARMLLEEYRRGGDSRHRETALHVLDTWTRAVDPSGLLFVHYEKMLSREPFNADTCNLGVAAAEFARCYRLLKEMGEERKDYLNVAIGICDFFTEHFSPEYGFGKSWDVRTGKLSDDGGTVGAYVITGLMELYGITGENKYLSTSEEAFAFYAKRDLDSFSCTAGALDTVCVDKESSGAMIISGILLYEATRKQEYLIDATRAAYYFCSWMFYYNAVYAPYSDFCRYGFATAGGTAVSTQHHHIDPWGALLAGWLLKLAQYTDDARWKRRASMLYRNTTQCVALTEGTMIHDLKRPLGSQNEAFLHCHWGWKESSSIDTPGKINDWLVAWPCAYRLLALDMAEKLHEEY